MNSKIGTIGALSAGGITVGAVATVSVMLLTGGSTFSEMSDTEALEHGFSQVFETNEASAYLKLLENLEGKPLSTTLDVTINSIIDEEELTGVNFGYTLETAAEELLFTLYGSSPDAPFDGSLSGTVYFSPEMLAFTSNAISKYVTINFDSFLEDYNNSYLATITGPLDEEALKEEGIDSKSIKEMFKNISEGVNAIDTEQLNKNLKAQLDEDIEILMNNLNTTRSDESFDVNGNETSKISVSVDSTYLLKIVYNQIIEYFSDKSVQEYINSLYPEVDFGGETYTDVSSAITAALALGYSTCEASFKESFGENLEFDVYFTEDADICRIVFPMTLFTNSDKKEEYTYNEALTIDFLGDDNICDEYKARFEFKAFDKAENVVEYAYVQLVKDVTKDTTLYELSFSEEDDDAYILSLESTLTDTTFKNILKANFHGADQFVANFNGTYKLTDNSIEINATKVTLDVANIPMADLAIKFSLAENTSGITVPSENTIKLTDMTLDDIASLAEEFGLFFGEEGYGEQVKQTIEAQIAMNQLKQESLEESRESSEALKQSLRDFYKSQGLSDEEIDELLN